MKKVLILLGSPRIDGNTAKIARMLVEATKNKETEIETVYLNSMNIKACQACGVCHEKSIEKCIIDDDMNKLYPKIIDADIIIFTSPIYFFNLSAQLKTLIDRFYAFGPKPRYQNYFSSKKFGFILSFGDDSVESSGAKNAISGFEDMIKYFEAESIGILCHSESEVEDVVNSEEIQKKCTEMSNQIAK